MTEQGQYQENKKNYASLHHSYDVGLAIEYGPAEATIIHNFQHWITLNRTMKRNFHEGRYWTYQTLEEIAAHYPYWTKEKVRKLLERLCSGKSRRSKKEKLDFEPVLMKGNFNKLTYDRTMWYAFVDEAKFLPMPYEEMGKCPNRKGQMPTPIPHTETNTELKKEDVFINTSKKNTQAEAFASCLLQQIKTFYPKIQCNLKEWTTQMDKLIKSKGAEDIQKILTYLENESLDKDFCWKKQVLSPSGLKKHFDKIMVKLIKKKSLIDVKIPQNLPLEIMFTVSEMNSLSDEECKIFQKLSGKERENFIIKIRKEKFNVLDS